MRPFNLWSIGFIDDGRGELIARNRPVTASLPCWGLLLFWGNQVHREHQARLWAMDVWSRTGSRLRRSGSNANGAKYYKSFVGKWHQ
jgi:hypothetical protein